MRHVVRTDAVCGLVTFAVGAFVAIEAQRIPDPGMDVIGPGAFPFGLGLVIAACGLALLVTSIRSIHDAESNEPPTRWFVLTAALALLVAYAHSLAYLGFPLATALFVPACLALLGARGALRLAAAGVAVSVAVFVIFGYFLRVDLPVGRWFMG